MATGLSVPYGLLFFPLSSTLVMLQCRDDCLFLAVAASEPSPPWLAALGPDVRCLRCLLLDVRAEALCTQHTSDSLPPQGSGRCTASILHKPARLALSRRLSLSPSLFPCAQKKHTHAPARTHTHRAGDRSTVEGATCCSLFFYVVVVQQRP